MVSTKTAPSLRTRITSRWTTKKSGSGSASTLETSSHRLAEGKQSSGLKTGESYRPTTRCGIRSRDTLTSMVVEISETVAHLRRRAAERSSCAAERRAKLEGLLRTAREILRQRGAQAVYAFGSVVTGDTTPRSDLDLATLGLPREAYFDALGELMRALPCDVDLVRLEEAPESLRDRVLAEGREL